MTIVTSGPEPQAQGVGYKVFCFNNGTLRGMIVKTVELTEGEWIVDQKLRTISSLWENYVTGFHIFQDREDAETYLESYQSWLNLIESPETAVLRKVRYRCVRARGKHEVRFLEEGVLRPCIVAKEMFIEPEEEKQCA
jgi:hypothetical protein